MASITTSRRNSVWKWPKLTLGFSLTASDSVYPRNMSVEQAQCDWRIQFIADTTVMQKAIATLLIVIRR